MLFLKIQKFTEFAMNVRNIPDNLTELNIYERFLKQFLEKYPEYQTKRIGISEAGEYEDHRLIRVMRKKWDEEHPDIPFFLEGNLYNMTENFFIPPEENVCVIRNLRYMPLLFHFHQFIEANYVVHSGGSSLISADRTLPLEDGDVILSPPGFSHCFHAMTDDSIIIDFIIRVTTFDTVFFNLLSGNNYLSALFSNALYGSSRGCILWHCREDSLLLDMVITAYRESRSSAKYHEKMLELLVMQFFVLLMRNHEQSAVFPTPYLSNSDEQVQALLNYMYTHCQTVTLSSLAMQFNYSDRQVIRILKKYTGKTFSQILTDIRMNKALQLLRNSSLPSARIAVLLGYSSKDYFRKVFQNTFSSDPEVFRKQLEEKKENTR